MPIYKVNGDTYDIPASKQEAFEKKYPDASVSYLNGSDEYEIPLSKRDAFVSKFPKATLKTYSAQQQDSFPMFDDEPNAPLNAYSKPINQSQNQPEQNDNVETNFFKGLHQMNKNIWQAGLWHSLRGEIANLFTGSSREEQAALNDIEYLESVGIDPREYLAGVEDAEFQKLYGMNREQFDALDKSERRRLAKDAASRQGELSKDAIKALEKERKQRQSVIDAYQDALAEAGGDLDKAKEILRAKAEDKTWGDEQIEKANAIYAENKELQGAAKWGGLLASGIPSAAALGLSFLTKGKTAGISRWLNKAAKLAGHAGMAGMSAGTAGLSMIEARQHGATNWETWTTGIADGLIEFITEKIPFDKLTKPVLTAAKTRTTKALMDAMRRVDSPGRKELEKLLTEANKKLGGKLLNGKNVADWLANAATEGVSEATAEALQTVTSMIYLNPEEYPTFADVANAAWEGAKGGIALGGILGGAGKAVEHSLHKDRRKQQGFVNVALVEQEGKNPFVAELVDYDPETKTYKALQDGEIVDVKEGEIQYKHQYTYNEFESGRYRQLEDEAIADGTVSDAQIAVSADRLGNARQKLESLMTEAGMTDEQKNATFADLEAGDIPGFPADAKALWDAADEYSEAFKRDKDIQSARDVKAENERKAVLDAMTQQMGGEFWQKGSRTMQENGMEIIEPAMVEVGTMQDGKQVFILSTPNDNGEVAAITEDGKKMFIHHTDLQDGTTIMPLQEFLDARVSEQKKAAEQTRMAEEAAPQLDAIRQKYQMGTQVNLGTEESPALGQVIGIKPENDGVFIQTEAGVVPYTYQQLADIQGTPIRVMTDAQIAAAEAAEIEAAESARMSELAQTPEQMTDAETVGDNAVQMENMATETPLPLNPDGSVNQDALFKESPARWAEWNDERKQDGGASSAQYISGKLAKAQARLAGLQTSYAVEDSLNKKELLEKAVIEQQGVVDELAEVMQKYAQAETAPVQTASAQSAPAIAQQERTTESVLASLNDGTLTDEEIRANIEANLAEAQKAYDKHAKKAPKMGTDKDAYLAEKQKYEQGLPALQQEIDFWNGVKQSYEGAMQQETMPTEESFRPELAEEDMEPQTPQELAARELGLKEGGIKLLWDSVQRHTGWGNGERKKFFGIFRSKDKGGMTIEAAGDRLMEIDREYDLGLLDQSDPMAGVNAILDVLGDIQTIGDLRNYIANNREAQVAREAAAAYFAMNAEFEVTHGMTMEEWAHANEVQRIEIMSKSALTEAEEYERNVKFAEEEYQYGTNEQSTGTEGVSGGENQGDAGNVEGAADGLYRQGDSILQEAQSDNTGGETVSAGQTEENVSESDNQDGDTSVHAGEQTAEVDDLPPAHRGVGRSQDDAEHLADPLAMTIETRLKIMAETREAIHERVNTWSDKLGIKINIIDNYRDVQNEDAKENIAKGNETFGWFEKSTGEIFIYVPDYLNYRTETALKEVEKTILHEGIAHKGMREMLGEEKYDELCDKVWNEMMTDKQRKEFIKYPGVNGNTRAAADEFIASVSENVKQDTVWDKIANFFKDILKSIGIEIKVADNDLKGLLKQSYQRYRKGEAKTNPGSNQQAEGNTSLRSANGSLVGMHNISEDKLRKVLKQGGLANPSTAVVNIAEYLLDGYGDISLIMPSSLVDANTGDNIGTYTGDAWTPTYPPISRKVDNKGWKVIKDLIRSVVSEDSPLYHDIINRLENYLEDNRSSKMEFVFLKEKGIEPEIAYKGADGFVGIRNLEAILGVQGLRDGLESYERYKNASPMAKRSFNMWLDAAGNKQAHKELKEQIKKEPKLAEVLKLNEDVSFAEFDSFTYDIFRKEQDAGKIDTYDTMGAAARYVDANNLRGEFEAWLESLMEQAGAKEVFFAGYTRDGDRIYKDNTLENVSRHMRLQGRTNAYDDHGLSATKSALLQRLTSLSQIRKNKTRLQNESAYNKEYDALKDRLFSIISQLADMQEISSNQFMNLDYAESRLQESFTKKNPIAHLNKEYGYDIDPAGEYADELKSFIKDVQQMPAKYFETKFERPVYLNEFAAAVMPTTTSEDIKRAVSEAGLPIFEYDSAVEGSRKEATLKATEGEGIRFRTEQTKDRVENLFTAAVNGTFKGKPVSIGTLTKEGKQYLESISGLRFKDKVDFMLNASDLVHMYNEHFGVNEKDPGSNIPLTIDDIRNIVDVVLRPEKVLYLGEDEGKRFAFLAPADSGAYNLIEVYTTKRGNLSSKTFYKTKKGVSHRAMILEKESRHSTFETNGATLSDAKIPILFDIANQGEGNTLFRTRITPEQDATYMKAVEAGDMETAQRMVNEAARLAGYDSSSDYQGSLAFNGAAPSGYAYYDTKEERIAAWENGLMEDDQTLGDYKDAGIDISNLGWSLTSPTAQRIGDKYTRESIKNLADAVNSDGRKIKVYRAVDTDIKEESIRNGDWITPSRAYAEYHIALQDWKEGRIIEQEVDIDDIWWDGNDINEWGYNDGKGYAYKNTPNNRKSLAPVTHDDAGNVIPLSERFTEEKDDIRFRVLDTTEAKLKEKPIKLNGMYRFKLKDAFKGVKDNGGSYPYIKVQLEEVPETYSGKKVVYNGILEGFAVVRIPKGLITEGGKDNVFFIEPKAIENELWDVLRATENYYEFKHGDAPYQRDWLNTGGVRFRTSNNNQAIFVSNAARAVEGIKQEKATPEQWLKMIEKNGGLKAGEDKWMGLSDWLKESDKKTLTKQEVLDFINENMIVIEEEHYGEVELAGLQSEFDEIYDQIIDGVENGYEDEYGEEYEDNRSWEEIRDDIVMSPAEKAWEELNSRYHGGDDFDMAFSLDNRMQIQIDDPEAAAYFLGIKPINDTRLDYTTEGLTNKHEIALTIPTVDPWETDDIHFGDAGDGRAVAWIRFGDTKKLLGTTEVDGKKKFNWAKVLVIDEIQSKRHQEGREKGYRVANIDKWLKDNNVEVIETGEFFEFIKDGQTDRRFSKGLMQYDIEKAKRLYVNGFAKTDVPDAPFDKNWHELAMKRMLRYAAENGYDVIAWTKGDQQAERYNIGNAIDAIYYGDFNGNKMVRLTLHGADNQLAEVDSEGRVVAVHSGSMIQEGMSLADIVGKEIALKIMNNEGEKISDDDYKLSGEGLRVGGEGMKGFYDKMLPAFMNKYGKKWGVKVEDINFPGLEGGLDMHSVPVTEEMKESVMEGQVMFRTTPISPDVQQEMAVISAQAIVNGNYMKAPNGKDSNLTPEQWAMVRTKNFKQWFGDWEQLSELKEIEARKVEWLSAENIAWAKGKTLQEIEAKFGNEPKAVAYLPVEYLSVFGEEAANLADNRVYSGKGYYIDHAANHHHAVSLEKYINIQEVINNYDHLKRMQIDGHESIVFIKKIDRWNAVSVQLEVGENGRIVWHKSFYDQKKEPYKSLPDVQLPKIVSPEGGVSSISPTENSVAAISLQSRDDNAKLVNFLNPANISKVVDENGEPMVVWRASQWGSNGDYTVFDKNRGGNYRGFYFTNKESAEKRYGGQNMRGFFINLRNPDLSNSFNALQGDHTDIPNNDGLIFNPNDNLYDEDYEVKVFEPNQIKSATDNTGEFSDNEDIRFKTVYGGNRGYVGYSMSKRAAEARSEGRYPKTDFRKEYNVTARALDLLEYCGIIDGSEWHHTSMYGNKTKFYGWYDDDYADIYSVNKKEIDALAREYKKKDEEYRNSAKAHYERMKAGEITPEEEWQLNREAEKTFFQYDREVQDKIDAIFNPVQPDGSGDETTMFKTTGTPTEQVVSDGFVLSNEDFTNLAGNILYRTVTDQETIDRLNSVPTIKVYRAMQVIDGKLYPPMSAKVDGKLREPIELGQWEEAEERPDLADDKGRFKLDKGNKTSVPARYNPYFHTSRTPLNDQFSSAQTRPNLVTVEVEIPESELTSGYKAEKAKDSVGEKEWKAGVVQGKLSGTRKVILSRWDKPIRIVPDSEVADRIVEMFEGRDITMPSNVVTPSLRAELEERGIPFVETDNQGRPKNDTRFRATGVPTESVVEDGLRLTPKQFTDLAANIFKAMPEDVRREVVDNASRDNYNLEKAVFQKSASLAEKSELSDSEIELAKMVAQKVEDAVLASGVEMTRPFTTNEALWMLYQSTNPMNESDPLSMAERFVVAHNLGFTESQQEEQEKDADNIRFRSARGAASNSAAAMYNNEQRSAWGMLRETYQDMYRSVKSLVQAIEKATGKDAQSWENILTSLNALSSKNLADKKKYLRDFLTPMWDSALAIRDKYHKSLEQIERYLMVKHGLERNRVLAARDARNFYREQADQKIAAIKADKSLSKAEQKARIQKVEDKYDNHVSDIEAGIDAKFQKFRAKDYGGLTALFSDFADYGTREDYESEELYQEAALAARTPKFATLAETEIEAQKEVDAFEKEVDKTLIDNLWKKINAATKETLRHQYANNMLTKEQYERVRDMFEFYVPLRGFVDTTAEDTYSYYVSGQQSKFANPLQGAKGRKTQAETPLGWIGSMAESAIQMDNKNTAKLALYYFAVNRPNNDVLKITPTWYEWTGEVDADGKKIYEPVYPTFNGPQSGPAMQAQMDAFESMMEQQAQAGNAYKGKQRIDLKEAVIRAPKSAPEHVVTVKVAGEDYSIIINANPRAAQAINGMLNIDKGDNPLYRAARAILRFQASIKTSLAPLFWITNFMRDMSFAFINTSIRNDVGYTKEFAKNYPHAFRVFSYVHKNKKAALGNSRYEKYYTEFAENGGITGYTSLTNNTEYDQMMKAYAKNARAGKFIKGIKGAFEFYQNVGESFEQVSRFAAYITARESGKDISESIYEAKEVTINFNRKGSGKAITWEESGKMRRKNGKPLTDAERIFFVTLGGLSPVARSLFMFFNAGMQGVRMIAKLAKEHPGKSAAWAGIVFTIGLVNAIIHALAEDDDEYLDMPDYVRRTNILIGKNGTYFKWSLPHEVRPFYAMTDIFVQHAMGRKPNENIAAELAETFGEWVPINPFKDGMNAFTPDIIRPFVEIKNNKDFTGSPIYREYRWLTEEQQKNMPAYEKGFDSTSKVLVDISEILNDVSGGDHTDAGFININPAVVEHLAQEYGGGPLKLAEQFFKTIGVMTGDQEFSIRNTPFLSTFMVAADDRYRNAHTTELFKYYKGMADDVKRRAGEYKADKDKEGFDKLRASDDFQIFQIYRKYEKRDKFYNEQLKRAKSDSERKDIMSLQDAHRKRMIEEISNL